MESTRRCAARQGAVIPVLCILLFSVSLIRSFADATANPQSVQLKGHIPAVVQTSQAIGPSDPNEKVTLTIVLPFRNQAMLDDLVRKLYDTSDPLYGKYLSTQQFVSNFGPSHSDYQSVATFARSHNMAVTKTIPSRKLLDVSGAVRDVEGAFGVKLVNYRDTTGRVFRAPTSNPSVPAGIASKISGITGLNTAGVWHKHLTPMLKNVLTISAGSPFTVGSAPSGGMTPTDIATAYNLKPWPPANPLDTTGYGKGQTLGLFELDVYTPSDILLYEQMYGLPQLIPTNVVVTPPTPTGGADEVTLDIELQLALAPMASSLLVYMSANSSPQAVQQYQQIADDNLAKQISTSWGISEPNIDTPTRNGENNAFQQMAAQGQSIYAASGDSGAYDGSNPLAGGDTTSLLVDDPASQPFMVGCGGTTLSVISAGIDEHYRSETTWGNPGSGQGSGGGISLLWSIPWYQVGAIPSNSLGSTTMRNVPDVALNGDPNTGYDIVFGGTDRVLIFGGTSCCSPIWAGFTARVNEARANNGLPLLGFANPAIYAIGTSDHYARDFHDVADGSTNLYYPAVAGHDNGTGWGSFIGNSLLTDLSAPIPIGLQAQPGNSYVSLGWNASSGATGYNVYRSVGSGAPSLIGSTSSTTFTNGGLLNGTTYNYFLQAVYAGSSSFQVGPASATPGSVAITAGPFSATRAGGAATITWTTNVLSDSTVYYGTNKNKQSLKKASSANVLQHSIQLTGLASGTTYYFYVTSFDGHATATSAVFSFKEPYV